MHELNDDGTAKPQVDITLPYELAEAALILLDVSIDQSGIDASELEQQRLAVIHELRKALGSDADYEPAEDDNAAVDLDGGEDAGDADEGAEAQDVQ